MSKQQKQDKFSKYEVSLGGHFRVTYLVDEDRLVDYFRDCPFLTEKDIKEYTQNHCVKVFLKWLSSLILETQGYMSIVGMSLTIDNILSQLKAYRITGYGPTGDDHGFLDYQIVKHLFESYVLLIPNIEPLKIEELECPPDHFNVIDLTELIEIPPDCPPGWTRKRVTIMGQYVFLFDVKPDLLTNKLLDLAKQHPVIWTFAENEPEIDFYLTQISKLILIGSLDPVLAGVEAVEKWIKENNYFLPFSEDNGILLRRIDDFRLDKARIVIEDMK